MAKIANWRKQKVVGKQKKTFKGAVKAKKTFKKVVKKVINAGKAVNKWQKKAAKPLQKKDWVQKKTTTDNKKKGWKTTNTNMKGRSNSKNWRNNNKNKGNQTKTVKKISLDISEPLPDNFKFTIALCIETRFVGRIIGKKGSEINKLKKETRTTLDFSDEDFEWEGQKYTLMKITGEEEQIEAACNNVSAKITEFAQAEGVRRTMFAIPSTAIGMIIGPKWGHLNQVKEANDEVSVWLAPGKDTIDVGPFKMKPLILFGPEDASEEVMGPMVKLLGHCCNRLNEGGMGGKSGDQTEVGCIVEKKFIGALIGPKGKHVWDVKKRSGVSKILFGDETFEVNNKEFQVVCIYGSSSQISAAAKLLAEKLSNLRRELESRLTFLVTKKGTGMLIGKKGATIQKIQGGGGGVWVNLSKDPINLPGDVETNTVTIEGPKKTAGECMDRLVQTLGLITKWQLQERSR